MVSHFERGAEVVLPSRILKKQRNLSVNHELKMNIDSTSGQVCPLHGQYLRFQGKSIYINIS